MPSTCRCRASCRCRSWSSSTVTRSCLPAGCAARCRRSPRRGRAAAPRSTPGSSSGGTTQALLDVTSCPARPTRRRSTTAQLAELCSAFERSVWARTPAEVEVPFEMVESRSARARPDGRGLRQPRDGWTVVDWKTGPPRCGREGRGGAARRLPAGLGPAEPTSPTTVDRDQRRVPLRAQQRDGQPADLLDAPWSCGVDHGELRPSRWPGGYVCTGNNPRHVRGCIELGRAECGMTAARLSPAAGHFEPLPCWPRGAAVVLSVKRDPDTYCQTVLHPPSGSGCSDVLSRRWHWIAVVLVSAAVFAALAVFTLRRAGRLWMSGARAAPAALMLTAIALGLTAGSYLTVGKNHEQVWVDPEPGG